MRVNWIEYFKEFCVVHGQSPVLYRQDRETGQGGYLLFADGWMYGREPSGPEIAPPLDSKKHLNLIKLYWGVRLCIVEEEFRKKSEELRELVQLQASRSAILIMPSIVPVQDEDGRVTGRRMENEPIDFEVLLTKVRELRDEVDDCRHNLLHAKIPEPVESQVTMNFSQAAVLAALEEIEYKERANGRA